MYRRSFAFLFTMHSVRAIPFAISNNEAKEAIVKKYNSRWYGPSAEYIHFRKTEAEYLPFFLCKGEMRGTYVGLIDYEERSGKDNTRSTRTERTSPIRLESSFTPNSAQVYAGYKFSNRQVMKVVADPEAPLLMKKIAHVDTTNANINLFEMSTTTLGATAKEVAKKFATEEAITTIKQFHSGGSNFRIQWESFEIVLDEVFPCYLPAIISEVEYDSELFTLYTSGRTGNSTGPYLLSGVAMSRTAAVATVGTAMLLHPSKLMGLVWGSLAAVPLSLAASAFAKHWPIYVRNRNRKQREKRQKERAAADSEGYRPNTESQRRVFAEKQRSQAKTAQYTAKKRQDGRVVKDVKGYYELLELRPDASIEEIRQKYRQMAILHHPDSGGDAEKMKNINEAYRVLRNPSDREAYDRK